LEIKLFDAGRKRMIEERYPAYNINFFSEFGSSFSAVEKIGYSAML